ncbi:MAG: LytR C-terminal domain-containing protein [Patescibacteria group bacterium]
MEEQYQNQEPQVSVLENQVPPQPIKKNKSGAKWLLIVILLLLIAGVAGFFLTQSQSEEELPSPTPAFEETATETPEATSTAAPISKADIKIEIQNGTGVAGEAGFLQTTLKAMGFENITVGNAATQDATTTTITFSSKVPSQIQDELTTKLKTIYTSLETKTSSTLTKSDILIVTGTRKGSSTATPKPSTSASPTAKPSVSPSPSPTATP